MYAFEKLDLKIKKTYFIYILVPESSYRVKNYEYRSVDSGAQLGDKRKSPSAKFDHNLKLPKGAYPEKHQEHTVSF